MAIYVMSDLHGRHKAFNKMLEQIEFNESDYLYILGDYVDWGEDSIGLLKELITLTEKEDSNIACLMGNHDRLMYDTISNLDNYKGDEVFITWAYNGGDETLEEYLKESKEVQTSILKWIYELRYFIPNLEVAGKKYYLCHSAPYMKGMTLYNVLWDRIVDQYFSKKFIEKYPDTTLISGHTISKRYNSMDSKGNYKIYKSELAPYINIDCGAKVLGINHGGRLGCLRLDDMAEFYIGINDIEEF